MYSEIIDYVKSCEVCQRTGRKTKKDGFLKERNNPTPELFSQISIDTMGPLNIGKKQYYVVVAIDQFSKFIYAKCFDKPVTSKNITDLINDVCTLYMTPHTILTDNGSVYVSKEVTEFCENKGIKTRRIPTYSPSSNGQVERANSTIKDRIKKAIAQNGKIDLKEEIKNIVHSYNCTPTRVLNNKSPFYILFGTEDKKIIRKLNIPTNTVERVEEIDKLNELRKNIPDLLHENFEKDAVSANKYRKKEEYFEGEKVLLKNINKESKLSAEYEGPYIITKKLGDLTFEVKNPNEVDENARKILAHINRMKKFKERQQ